MLNGRLLYDQAQLQHTIAYVLAICVYVVLDRHLVICVGCMSVCVVLDRHLVICVGYTFVCEVLDRHLVCFVLAALWLYVKWGAWCAPDARGEWPL